MPKKIKLEVTKPQLDAIVQLKDDIESMIGTGEDDAEWIKCVRLINNILSHNKNKPKSHE